MPTLPLPPDQQTVMPRVLLVTHDWSTLTELPWLFREAGCRVDVLCPAGNWAIRNGFYDRWLDAGPTLESLLETLETLVAGGTYRTIVIGDDPILWAIYRRRLMPLWPLLPLHRPEALPILNKLGLAEHCRTHAIPCPPACRVENADEALAAAVTLGLPLVFKENYSNGGQGVWVIRDEAACRAFAASHGFGQPLLAQRFVAGRHVDVEALFKEGHLLQYVCAEILEDNHGPSSKRRYFPNPPQIGAILVQLGQTTGLHGFANVALMQEESSGRYLLFEADPRPNKWVPYGRWFGQDFVSALRVFLGLTPVPPADPDTPPVAVACWEVEHFSSHVTRLLNAGRYLDAILHLLDFDRTWRPVLYDPVLLKAKMDALRGQILPKAEAWAARAAQQVAALQQPNLVVPVPFSPEAAVTTVTIDNHTYDVEALPAEARAQVVSIQFVDQELARLQAQVAALQTARNAYSQALVAAVREADSTAG